MCAHSLPVFQPDPYHQVCDQGARFIFQMISCAFSRCGLILAALDHDLKFKPEDMILKSTAKSHGGIIHFVKGSSLNCAAGPFKVQRDGGLAGLYQMPSDCDRNRIKFDS
jgi:hypothetical protein